MRNFQRNSSISRDNLRDLIMMLVYCTLSILTLLSTLYNDCDLLWYNYSSLYVLIFRLCIGRHTCSKNSRVKNCKHVIEGGVDTGRELSPMRAANIRGIIKKVHVHTRSELASL